MMETLENQYQNYVWSITQGLAWAHPQFLLPLIVLSLPHHVRIFTLFPLLTLASLILQISDLFTHKFPVSNLKAWYYNAFYFSATSSSFKYCCSMRL